MKNENFAKDKRITTFEPKSNISRTLIAAFNYLGNINDFKFDDTVTNDDLKKLFTGESYHEYHMMCKTAKMRFESRKDHLNFFIRLKNDALQEKLADLNRSIDQAPGSYLPNDMIGKFFYYDGKLHIITNMMMVNNVPKKIDLDDITFAEGEDKQIIYDKGCRIYNYDNNSFEYLKTFKAEMNIKGQDEPFIFRSSPQISALPIEYNKEGKYEEIAFTLFNKSSFVYFGKNNDMELLIAKQILSNK